jgi:hypothetical protein
MAGAPDMVRNSAKFDLTTLETNTPATILWSSADDNRLVMAAVGNAMPRKTKHPIVYIMLSPSALATACDLNPAVIYREILAGRLEVRTLPGTVARRIWIADAEKWFREYWLPAKPNKSKKDVPYDDT